MKPKKFKTIVFNPTLLYLLKGINIFLKFLNLYHKEEMKLQMI